MKSLKEFIRESTYKSPNGFKSQKFSKNVISGSEEEKWLESLKKLFPKTKIPNSLVPKKPSDKGLAVKQKERLELRKLFITMKKAKEIVIYNIPSNKKDQEREYWDSQGFHLGYDIKDGSNVFVAMIKN